MNTSQKLLLPVALTLYMTACSNPAKQPEVASTSAASESTPSPAVTPPPSAAEQVKPVEAHSGTYTLDSNHTNVLLQWNHFGFSNPSAHFGNVEGTVVYDAADVTKSTVQVTLPLSGLNSFTAKLDEHLKSTDFFDAAKFPSITFKSTKVVSNGTNKLAVTGDLTVKGITKPVTLDVTINGAGEHPMTKKQAIGFDANATIKRSEFGMSAYVPNVSDEIKVRITAEAQLEGAVTTPHQ
ncbi:polyisoprenoid-binding protein [Xylella fastidiosa]|uniref:Polyisoprenoid-binding protein n=1 Tax=Xylella fastidiosa TaxID=2371 RepID=A0ABD7BYA6_XYLFS|nr:YceI family protein [Xylella fastidiosa]QPB72698.1 polyisoprenoid-binding protein [Xylella fastidiosa]QPB73027.1 polyisoprenoid-binding protein [Xylella fastidiosa]